MSVLLGRSVTTAIVGAIVELRDELAGRFLKSKWQQCVHECGASRGKQGKGKAKRKAKMLTIGFVDGCRMFGEGGQEAGHINLRVV